MTKKGRPKIYYDFSSTLRKFKIEEPLDLLLKNGIITIIQHKLALNLRWMFTLNFGLPTVQAYNINKVRGRDVSKYDDDTLAEIRYKYKQIIDFLYLEDKLSAKALINVIIHHKQPDKNINLIIVGAKNLEIAYGIKKKAYNIINDNNRKLNSYVH
jgi:hypothetical protein